MKKRLCLFFCFLGGLVLNFSVLVAQDLTGIWRGHFRSNDGLEHLMGSSDYHLKYDDRYKMEVQIAQNRNRFEAVTYSYRSTEFYGKAEARGTLNAQTKKVLLKEGKLLELRMASGTVCIMTCFMQYTRLGDDEYLQGTYYSVNAKDTALDCGKGSIFLHRVLETDFHKEPFLEKREKELLALKKSTPKNVPPTLIPDSKTTAEKNSSNSTVKTKPASPPVNGIGRPAKPVVKSAPLAKTSPKPPPDPAQKKSSAIVPEQSQNTRDSAMKITHHKMPVMIPEVLKTRTNLLLKTITVGQNKIELRLYDDGAIDNDTVSVYFDNKLVISKVRLTDQPITLHLTIEPSDQPHELVMVAENLGEIPPNTSLLVVRDGEKRYEERIISTEQKNVQINFMYKKIE